jgi:hypothetical protein
MAAVSKLEFWRKQVAAFRKSGLTRRAWCDQEGVSFYSLRDWLQRLNKEIAVPNKLERAVVKPKAMKQRLVPVVVADGLSGKVLGGEPWLLTLGATRLQLPREVDALWLARLLRELS